MLPLTHRRARGFCYFAFLILTLISGGAQAAYVYGPPYSYNTAVGSKGGFLSVDAAVGSWIADQEGFCNSKVGTCKPHTYSTVYKAGSGTAAIVSIQFVNADGTSSTNVGAYIWASDVTGSGFQPKNAGGCDTMCSGGEGQAQDTGGPRGSSGNGTVKNASSNAGSSLEGDPINAANGNAYRQDTDVATSRWLTFRRFYNSSSFIVATTMGPQWRHSFDRSLALLTGSGATGGQLYARRPDGSLIRFRSNLGVWKADSDQAETLSVVTDPATGKTTGYRLRVAATQNAEFYDDTGRLVSIVDDNGWVTQLTYSDASTPQAVAPAPGLLIGVTDPQGRSLALRYDGKGRLSSVTDPAGKAATYDYADSGNLAKVTRADGTALQYVYAEPANAAAASKYPSELTGVVDEKGVRFETVTYDATNHALSSQYAGGADKMSLSYYNFYSNGGIPAKVTTPLGLQLTLNFADDGAETLKPSGTASTCGTQCNQLWKSITYDSNGYPASYTDYRNTVTKTTADVNGLVTQQIDASGTDVQRTIVTTWDTLHRQPLTRTTSNAKGVVVAKSAWAYNDRGQLTAECAIDPSLTDAYACGSSADAPTGVRQTRYTYCDAVDADRCPLVGLLLAEDGPRTDIVDVTSYAYYPSTDESGCGAVGGACHRAGDQASITDAAGHVTRILAYDQHGRAVRKADANGVISDLAYTSRGWLAGWTVRARADGAASAGDATTSLKYDAVGALATVVDPDGVTLAYTYDDAHRLIDVTDAQANHIHYTLDASGNRIKEETFDAQGVSLRSLSRKFNNVGQLISATDGLGRVVFDATASGSYDVNGNLVSSKDALGIVRKDSYDALDRLIASVANANGTDVATKASATAFVVDALDQIRSVTDPDGLVTSYDMDGLRNPVGQTSPDSGTQSTSFDVAGNAVGHLDGKGTLVTQGFDALGRKISASYADATLNIAYRYDEADSVTGCTNSFPVGRLTRLVEAAVTTVYCYDNQGRVTEQRQAQGLTTDVTSYVYTRAGRQAAVASPDGLVTEYGRDVLGHIATVMVTPANGSPSQVVSSTTYLPFGPLAGYVLGNGQSVTRRYDANYRVTDVTSAVLNLHVALDAAGNVVAMGDVPGAKPATETYAYDSLYRLTAVNDASGKAIEAYTYNRTGDRLSKTAAGLATGSYGYQAGSHRLVGVGTASRTYDANGSTTAYANAGVAWGYGYNDRGQMTVVQQGGTTVATYVYNAFGQRVGKVAGSDIRRFAYATTGSLLGEYGSASRDYVWLDRTPVAVVDQKASATAIGFVQADALDTPRAVVDQAGALIWSWSLKGNPFGEAAPTSPVGFVLNLRFPGQYADGDTGLVYNDHRYYDAPTGRYIGSDPIGLRGGSSTYAYVSSSPLVYSDALGLCKTCTGRARVLKGNANLVGRGGGFDTGPSNLGKYAVTSDSAAIIPSQFGKTKSSMRPDIENISGKIDGTKTTFSRVRDVVDDQDARTAHKWSTTQYQQDVIQRAKDANGGETALVIELPGIDKDLGVQNVTLTIPDTMTCPEGTH